MVGRHGDGWILRPLWRHETGNILPSRRIEPSPFRSPGHRCTQASLGAIAVVAGIAALIGDKAG